MLYPAVVLVGWLPLAACVCMCVCVCVCACVKRRWRRRGRAGDGARDTERGKCESERAVYSRTLTKAVLSTEQGVEEREREKGREVERERER